MAGPAHRAVRAAAAYYSHIDGSHGVGQAGLEAIMTTRVYLAAARLIDDSPAASDLPAERVFINASEVPEVWVETESPSVPDVGKAAGFALSRSLNVGFVRIVGTVERRVSK